MSAQQNPTAQVNGDSEKNGSGLKSGVSAAKGKAKSKKEKVKDKKDPPGGFDGTPIPFAPDGYTMRFTFHRAENLPMSDLNNQSSDPFLTAELSSALPKRHKEDPDLIFRTPTVHKSTAPKWDTYWTVAGVPSCGFRLKCRLYDEDAQDHDDRLGNVSIYVDHVSRDWTGIQEQCYDVKKRMASKRAYMIRGCAAMLNPSIHLGAYLYVSAEVLGESERPYGRMYTIEQTYWYKHFSPMIGRLAGTKAPESEQDKDDKCGKIEKYDFQACQYQLQGPVPAELYHRFVEFKPFVKGMFSKVGIRGRILNKALHHQHARIYSFSNTTLYGTVKPRSNEAALQFLKLVHFDEGGRLFTYVLTLDGLLRFTETGKEFGIDLLSKHTMHSDVNIYIACSGEFFVRRLSHPKKSAKAPEQKTHPNDDIPGGPPSAPPPQNPGAYELVIDNDSGTYRPKGSLLTLLKTFLNENFPGLHVITKECTDDELQKMKGEQRERKKEGNVMQVMQQDSSDSDLSSSDEEELAGLGTQGRKKTPRQRALNALEDPSKAAKELFPGEKGKHERERREEIGDRGELQQAPGTSGS